MPDTQFWLNRLRENDPAGLQGLFETLYAEIKQRASQQVYGMRATLTPTELVNEVYVRLSQSRTLDLQDRQHFFACVARAMRFVLIDAARRKQASVRDKQDGMDELERTDGPSQTSHAGSFGDLSMDVLALDQALSNLQKINERAHRVVELRYFAGLEFEVIADLLETSVRTAKREWERARAFLHSQLHSAAMTPIEDSDGRREN